MVRLNEHRSNSELEEQEFVDRILKSEKPLELLTKQLENEKCLLLEINAHKELKKLQVFIIEGIKVLAKALQAKARQKVNTSMLENELLGFLKVHRKMSRNSSYFKSNPQAQDNAYLQILVWSSQMELSEEVMCSITQFSFDKTMKLYYYYFKYYMSHLNLFYQNQIKIKNIFLPSQRLDFVFSHQGIQHQLHIQNLHDYVATNCLQNCYSAASHINFNYHLELQEDSHIFHALMVKIKIILQKNRNILARTIVASYWIFSYIDLAWVKAGQKITILPEMFTVSPDYYQLCQQILSVFFVEEAEEATQMLVLDLIDTIEELQDRVGIKELSIGLVDNINTVLDILNSLNEILSDQKDMDEQGKKKCFLEVFKKSQNMEKLLKILYNNFEETPAIHNITQEIVEKIYNRVTPFDYSQNTIQTAGNILLSLEVEDEHIFEISMKQILNNLHKSSPYLKSLATLLETNYLRQRRDSGAVARRVSESEIFKEVNKILEAQNISSVKNKSLLLHTIMLISNVCGENPVLTLLIDESGLMTTILDLLKQISNVESIQNAICIIQFMHNICLKECQFRERVLEQYVDAVICNILTSDIFKSINNSRQINNLWTNINRLISNISASASYVYGGLVHTLEKIYFIYKSQIDIEACFSLNGEITPQMKNSMNQIVKNDKRFSLILKIIEKCLPEISNKMSNGTVIIIYEQLIQIGIICEKSLLSMPTQSRFLLNLLADLCEKYVGVIKAASKHLTKKKKKAFSQKFIVHQFLDLDLDQAQQQKQPRKVSVDEKPNKNSEIEEKQENIEEIQNQLIGKPSEIEQPYMHFKIVNPHFDQLPKELQEKLRKNKKSFYVTYLRELLAKKRSITVDKPCLSTGIPKYSSMLVESLKCYNKNKTPRKLVDIFFSEDRFSQETFYEAQVLFSVARIQKLLTLLSKEIGVKKFLNINFSNYLLKIQMFLPQIQHIVAMEHVQVIEESLKTLKNITIDTKTLLKRSQPLQVISEQMEGNELHGQLNEKKSFFYCLVETLQKFYPKMDSELSSNFLNDVIRGYIMNLRNEVDSILEHKYKDLLSLQKCRGWIKVLLELFSGFSQEKEIKKNIQIFIFSYLVDSEQNLLEIIFNQLKRILMFLIEQNSKYFPHNSLPNTQQNRQIVCQKMMTKMIINRIHSFIIYCLIDFDYYIDEAPDDSKDERIITCAKYIEKYVKEYSNFFIQLSKVAFNIKLNLKEIFIALHVKIKFLRKHEIWQEERLSGMQKQKKEQILSIKNRIEENTSYFHNQLLEKMIFPDLVCDYRIPIMDREELNLKEKYETNNSLERLYNLANEEIMRITHNLFTNYKVTFSYNKKIVQAIYEEKVDYEAVNIKQQIKKLNNVLRIIYRIIFKIDKAKQFFSGVSFNYGYMNELIELITVIINNLESTQKNDEYYDRANDLVKNTLLIVRAFNTYCINKEEQEALRQKMKKKEKKKLKKKSKNQIKEKKIQEKKKEKRDEKKEDKKKQVKKVNEEKEKILRRDKSKINLVSTPHKLEEMEKKNRNPKRPVRKSLSKFSESLKQFIKSSLQISSKTPFLRNLTLQLIMLTINNFMIKDEHAIKQQKHQPTKIQLDSLDILPYLLKTRINEIKHEGFFHMLSEMGVQLIDKHEIMVKTEMGVKRMFYERKSHEIEFKQFKRSIIEYVSLDPEQFSHFLNLKYKENDEQKVSPFDKKFIKACKDKSSLSVVLKQNSPLNVISYNSKPHFKKKKSEVVQNEEEENEQVKSVDYVPSKAMSTYIYQLIYNILRLMIRGLVETQEKEHKMVDEKQQQSDEEKADPFNITVLVEALQVVMRWSPCLTPYVTKFKCRKMIGQVMNEFSMSEKLRQFINKILSLDDKKQITFLAVLIRGVTPLFFNRNFTIIFEMCLDNTVLQKQKNPHNSTTNETIYIPFGQVVRQRAIMEIEDQLKKTPFLVKKLTLLNLLTTLISIREFAVQCIQSIGFISTLHDTFCQVFRKMRDNKVRNLSFISKNVVIPFFLSPISLLQQLSISLQIDKKKKPNRKIPVGFQLQQELVENQLLEGQFFKLEKKFRQNWPYIGLLDYPQFADQSEIDETSLDSSSSHLGSSIDLGDIPPPDQFDDFELSQLNSHNQHENSWIQNDVSNSAGYRNEHSPMQLNLYPLPGVDDSIIQNEESQDQNSQLSSPESDYFSSEDQGDSHIGESSVIDLISPSGTEDSGDRPRYPNPRGIDLYEDFDNVISYDRTDQSNPIYRAEKEQENLLHDLLLLYGGNKDKKILKMEPIKQIFGEQEEMISYCENVEFNNFSKFESYFWMPPNIFKTIKAMEDQIVLSSDPISKQIKEILNIQSNNRRSRFIFENNNNNLLELNREVQLMHPQDIVEEINRVQIPSEQENEDEQRNREMQRYIEEAMREGNFIEGQYQEHPGITNEELENRLREQGFSMQSYRNLPRDIRQDIINNILEQNRRNDRSQQEHERQEEEGQIINEQSESSQNSQIEEESVQEISPIPHFNSPEQNSEDFAGSHKRISFEHSQKISKDRFFMLNKDGKNDHKFFQCSEEFLFNLFDLMLFTLNDSDFIYFPYEFLRSLCINSANQLKILSTLVGILLAGPNYQQQDFSNGCTLPFTKIITDNQQIQQNYSRIIFPALSLKILYTLHYLSKQYALAITMLNPIFKPISHLDLDYSSFKNKSILELIISLLRYPELEHENLNHLYLIKVINNLTLTNFNYHIFMLYSEKTHEIEKQKNMTIELSSDSNQLICDLLQNNQLKDDRHLLSQIIMRLSLNQSNVSHFIKHFHQLIKDLASKTLTELKEISQKYELVSKTQHHKVNFKQKVLKFYSESKIVQLLNMFYEIMKSFRMALPAEDKTKVIDELKKVLLCQEIKLLCETGCEIIVSDPSAPQLVAKVHEFMDCFFAIYNILKVSDHDKQKKNEKIKIASLSKINNTMQLNKKQSTKKKFISDFIDLGYLWDKKICTVQGKAFVNANIKNKLTSLIKNMKREGESLLEIPIIDAAIETPYMLEFQNKKMLFKAEIKRLKYKKSAHAIYLLINREDVFQQSFTEIMSKKAEQLKGKLQVEFQGEQGEDAGGLTREWYQLLSKEMFNPNYALFTPSSTGNTYQPSSKSYVNEEHEKYFKFIGRVMGKALHDGFLLDAYFTPAFYKHILSLPISYEDMEEEDYEFFNSLKWILNNSPIEDYMQLFFTYQFDNFGVMETRKLCQNGDQKLVTEENKEQYVELISYAKMATAVQKQLENFLEGFHDIIPRQLVRIFDEKELQIMISGLPTIDIDDLKRNTDLVNYNKTDQIIVWLFEVLEQFDMGLRTSFLQFVTGTSRVPSQGFKGLQGFNGPQKFNIHKDFQSKHLPRAHTCFNQLDLPNYQTKQILIEKLTLAITEAKQGFGMI